MKKIKAFKKILTAEISGMSKKDSINFLTKVQELSLGSADEKHILIAAGFIKRGLIWA